MERYLTVGELVERLGVSRQRVSVILREAEVERVWVNPRLTLVSERDVREIEAKRAVSSRVP